MARRSTKTDITKDEKKTVELVEDGFYSSEENQKPWREEWNEIYRMYKGILLPSERVSRNFVFYPLTFATHQTIQARLRPAVLTNPFAIVIPGGANDGETAEIHNGILSHQLEIKKIYKDISDSLHSFGLFGTGVLKVFPVNLYKPNYDVLVKDTDLYDFYPDAWGKTMEDCEYVIHRTFISKTELRELGKLKGFKNIELAINSAGEKTGGSRNSVIGNDDGVIERRIIAEKDSQNRSSSSGTVPGRPYERLEYWSVDKRIVVINRTIPIFDNENVLEVIPFVKIDNMPDQGEFYSAGDSKEIIVINKLLNRLIAQRFDNVEMKVHQMWKVLNDRGVDLERLVSQAGGIIKADTSDAVEAIQQPDLPASAYQEELALRQMAQQISGVTDVAQGLSGAGQFSNETATGINLLKESSNQRFKDKLVHIAIAQGQVAELCTHYNSKFMPDDIMVEMVDSLGNITQEEMIGLREQLKGQFNFHGQANLFIESDQFKMQKAQGAIQMFAQDPEINTRELKREYLKASGYNNLDAILLSQQESQARQQQAAEQMQAQQQAAVEAEIQKTVAIEQVRGETDVKIATIKAEMELQKAKMIAEMQKESKGESTNTNETRGRKSKNEAR